jgi:hypothetical protein
MSTALSRAARRSRAACDAGAAAGCTASFFGGANCAICFSDSEDGSAASFITGYRYASGNSTETCSNTGTESCSGNRDPK